MPGKAAVGAGEHQLHQVVLQPRQDRLGLGIAEAGVELEHPGAVGGQHQTGIEHAPELDAPPRQLGHGRPVHGFDDLVNQLRRHSRHRAVTAHAAGVGPAVAFVDALVVLRRLQRQDGLAVAKRQHRAFVADQAFLHQHIEPGVTEGAVDETGAAARLRLRPWPSAMMTPLPAARPLALTTTGKVMAERCVIAAWYSTKRA